MTKNIGFYKKDSLWYADVLKDLAWMGVTEANCLMVSGAPEWLEGQAKGMNYITLQVSTEGFDEADGFLQKTSNNFLPWEGADYHDSLTGESMWLCGVNFLVFGGKHPKFIYYKIVNNEEQAV